MNPATKTPRTTNGAGILIVNRKPIVLHQDHRRYSNQPTGNGTEGEVCPLPDNQKRVFLRDSNPP